MLPKIQLKWNPPVVAKCEIFYFIDIMQVTGSSVLAHMLGFGQGVWIISKVYRYELNVQISLCTIFTSVDIFGQLSWGPMDLFF